MENSNISLESQKKIILVCKAFLDWARGSKAKGTRKISQKSLKGFVPPKIPASASDPISVSLDEILKIISFDFGDDYVYIRDLAAMCFAFLSGARPGAIATAPILAIDLNNMRFRQEPNLGVKTKNGKSALTFLLPIPELVAVVKRWDDIVRSNLPDTALWYPPLDSHWGVSEFTTGQAGKNRNHAILDRFSVIYEKAGMGELYKSPHKFRHGHAVYSLSRCKNMAEYQAVSRNLMHSSLAITDKVYAVIEQKERQGMIASFTPKYEPVVETDLDTYLNKLGYGDRLKAIKILADSLGK